MKTTIPFAVGLLLGAGLATVVYRLLVADKQPVQRTTMEQATTIQRPFITESGVVERLTESGFVLRCGVQESEIDMRACMVPPDLRPGDSVRCLLYPGENGCLDTRHQDVLSLLSLVAWFADFDSPGPGYSLVSKNKAALFAASVAKSTRGAREELLNAVSK